MGITVVRHKPHSRKIPPARCERRLRFHLAGRFARPHYTGRQFGCLRIPEIPRILKIPPLGHSPAKPPDTGRPRWLARRITANHLALIILSHQSANTPPGTGNIAGRIAAGNRPPVFPDQPAAVITGSHRHSHITARNRSAAFPRQTAAIICPRHGAARHAQVLHLSRSRDSAKQSRIIPAALADYRPINRMPAAVQYPAKSGRIGPHRRHYHTRQINIRSHNELLAPVTRSGHQLLPVRSAANLIWTRRRTRPTRIRHHHRRHRRR